MDFDTACRSLDETTPIGDGVQQRRQHFRVYDGDGAIAVQAERAAASPATLFDESCAGIGIELDASWAVRVGEAVSVDFFGIPMRGVVRHRTPMGVDRQRIGVERLAGA